MLTTKKRRLCGAFFVEAGDPADSFYLWGAPSGGLLSLAREKVTKERA